MRYIDSGDRDSQHTLGKWLQIELTADITDMRLQSGVFTANALGIIAPALQKLSARGQVVRAIIGSNYGETVYTDVLALMLMGIPYNGPQS